MVSLFMKSVIVDARKVFQCNFPYGTPTCTDSIFLPLRAPPLPLPPPLPFLFQLYVFFVFCFAIFGLQIICCRDIIIAEYLSL